MPKITATTVRQCADMKDELLLVPINSVHPMSDQPRKHFSESGVNELAQSIKSEGLDNPIKVRRINGVNDRYEIIDGERRWRACRLIGLEFVEIIVRRTIETNDVHFMSLRLNFNREDHTHMEISNALQREKAEFGRSVEEIAQGLGRSIPWVYQYLSLQKIVSELKTLIDPPTPKDKRLRMNVAILIASVPAERQMEIYEEVHKNSAQTRQRLKKAKELAAEITGRAEKQKNDIRSQIRSFNRAIPRIAADVELIMDMSDKVFRNLIVSKSPTEIEEILKMLSECRDQLETLTQVILNETKKHGS